MARRFLLISILVFSSLGLFSARFAFAGAGKAADTVTSEGVTPDQFEAKWSINWVAVSSVATLAAVIVALFAPLGWEIYRRRQAARVLRQQILMQLMLLRTVVARRFGETGFGSATYSGLDAKERTPIDAIETLFSQAHLLKANEHDELVRMLVNLKAIAQLPLIEPSDGRRFRFNR